MEEANALTQQQQYMQRQQQQLLMLQQLQRNQQQQDAISRFPSNIDRHLRPQQQFLHRPNSAHSLTPNLNNPSSNATSSHPCQFQASNQLYNSPQGQQYHHSNQNNNCVIKDSNINKSNSSSSNPLQQQQQQQKTARANPAELQAAYQDAWRVCHPDFKRPFSSLEDACERLLPYHVVADYEAEEDDKILDADPTGQMSRCQQWDHNIAAKVAEFTATFEKQVLAFNIITRKRGIGEFRTEEKVMLEQFLLHEEKRAYLQLKAEIISKQKMSQETTDANLSMAMAMAHGQPTHGGLQIRGDMVCPPIRGSQANSIPIRQEMVEQGQEVNYEEMDDGWGNDTQRDDMEPSENFLNDEETDGDTGT